LDKIDTLERIIESQSIAIKNLEVQAGQIAQSIGEWEDEKKEEWYTEDLAPEYIRSGAGIAREAIME